MAVKRIRIEVWLTDEQIETVKRYTKEVHESKGSGVTWRNVLEARTGRLLGEEIKQMGAAQT